MILPVALVLASCGAAPSAESVSQGEEAALRGVIEDALETDDPSNCDRFMTQRFREQSTAMEGRVAVRACHEAAEMSGEADSVDIEELRIHGGNAEGRVAINGGDADGMTMTVSFVKQGGWRFDRLTGVKFDRARFDRAVLASLSKEYSDMDDAVKDCISSDLKSLSDAQLERVFVDSKPGPFVRPFIECSMRVELEKEDAPAQFVDCMADQVMAELTDAKLETFLRDAYRSKDSDAVAEAFFERLGERAALACDEQAAT